MCEILPLVAAKPQPKHVLIVDDNVHLRFTLASWLRLSGYGVYEAATADEALTLLQSQLAVDYVITDVQMPGTLDGIDLARHIRETYPVLPVAVVSGLDLEKSCKSEAISFFRKPYNLEAISAEIDKEFNGQSGAKEQ